MTVTTRRAVLTSLAAAAAGLPLLSDLAGHGNRAAAEDTGSVSSGTQERYGSNTALYASTEHLEDKHWVRRYRRHETVDNFRTGIPEMSLTSIIAPHGGAIERGTSELCLAVAGYQPTVPAVLPTDPGQPLPLPKPIGNGVPVRDYWLFEALADLDGNPLHVTSTHCDDPAALAITGGSRYAVSLHGFSPEKDKDGNLIGGALQVLIGGRDQRLMRNIRGVLANRSFTDPARPVNVTIAAAGTKINGDEPTNIVNRTYSGAGAQLEISTELRKGMFGDWDTAAKRQATYGQGTGPSYYWNGFVDGVREAIRRHERGLDWPPHDAVPYEG
ncbi:poly-gamma-glutamate hydrolase family protein [Kitasatospora sp. NPDC004240]